MQENMFTLLLIIWLQALAYIFHFWQAGVVIIMILKASVLRADEKPENNFYTRFYTSFEMSEFQMLGCFTGWRICRLKKCANLRISRKRILEGLNGINLQPSNGPKINRQPSKKEYFYRQPSNERAKISFLTFF